MKKREFNVIVKRDEDGTYVATVPALGGCHAQARSQDILMMRVRKAIALYLEAQKEVISKNEFVGVYRVTVGQ